MRAAVISITENGGKIAEKLAEKLPEYEIKRFAFHKYPAEGAESFPHLSELVGNVFEKYNALVFICACGIVVRDIAPLLKSKVSDPAVIVIDERGKYVIPLLSGHLGRANRFSEIIADKLGAHAVITTATDIGGKFSPDSFAKSNNLIIENIEASKEIAAAVLRNEKIALYSDFPCENIPNELFEDTSGKIGIRISSVIEKPFKTTLNLVPINIVLGIGCRKNIPFEIILRRVRESLAQAEISEKRVCEISTIDIKSEETGILELCSKLGAKFSVYSAERLMELKGDFSSSDFVMKTTGCDNVCERAASFGDNRLVMRKNAADGVAVAAAEKRIIIDFGKELL